MLNELDGESLDVGVRADLRIDDQFAGAEHGLAVGETRFRLRRRDAQKRRAVAKPQFVFNTFAMRGFENFPNRLRQDNVANDAVRFLLAAADERSRLLHDAVARIARQKSVRQILLIVFDVRQPSVRRKQFGEFDGDFRDIDGAFRIGDALRRRAKRRLVIVIG